MVSCKRNMLSLVFASCSLLLVLSRESVFVDSALVLSNVDNDESGNQHIHVRSLATVTTTTTVKRKKKKRKRKKKKKGKREKKDDEDDELIIKDLEDAVTLLKKKKKKGKRKKKDDKDDSGNTPSDDESSDEDSTSSDVGESAPEMTMPPTSAMTTQSTKEMTMQSTSAMTTQPTSAKPTMQPTADCSVKQYVGITITGEDDTKKIYKVTLGSGSVQQVNFNPPMECGTYQGLVGNTMNYSGGKTCPNGTARSTKIIFSANSANSAPKIQSVTENPECTYTMTVEVPSLC